MSLVLVYFFSTGLVGVKFQNCDGQTRNWLSTGATKDKCRRLWANVTPTECNPTLGLIVKELLWVHICGFSICGNYIQASHFYSLFSQNTKV